MTGSEQLQYSWKQLEQAWQELSAKWSDEAQQKFRKQHWEPFARALPGLLKRLQSVDQDIARIHRDCP